MGLTQVSTDGVKNDAITKTKIPANQIEASELADNAVDTNAIADQAVALSKLPHGDSNNNGKFLRANNGADPSFETISTTPADGSITSAKIADGAIVNADINASAAIAGTKVSPDFGSQNISLSGQISVEQQYPVLQLRSTSTTADSAKIRFGDSASAQRGSLEYDLSGLNALMFKMGGSGNNIERMRLTGDGKLGIGTTSPQEILHVKGASKTVSSRNGVIFGSTDSLAADKGLPLLWAVNIGSDADYPIASICGRKENATSDNGAGYLQFATGNAPGSVSEHMRLTSGGQLLIGATTPHDDELFRVHEDGTDNELANFRCSNASHAKSMINMIHMGSGDKVFFNFRRGGSLTLVGRIYTSASSTTYQTSSDYRLKENVTGISDGITRLKTLKPYRFNFKIEPDKTVDGFFAHEVTAVPEAISGTKDEVETTYYKNHDTIPEGKAVGDVKDTASPVYQGIDHSKLVPLLTAALQEAIAKIETLETKVAALEAA